MSSGHVTLDESCSKCLPWLRRQTRRKKSNLQSAFSIESLHGQARNKLRSPRKHETSVRLNKRKPRILRRWDLSPTPISYWSIASLFLTDITGLHVSCSFAGWHNAGLGFVCREKRRYCGARSCTSWFWGPPTVMEQDAPWVTVPSEHLSLVRLKKIFQ